MIIRPIKISDVDQCRGIVLENWGVRIADRFTREVSQCWSDGDITPAYYVAETDGKVAGFAGMIESLLMADILDFIWINVRKDFQSEGIGKKLTEYRIREALKQDTRVIQLMTQTPKISFFQQFGFHVVKNYGHPGNWNLMILHLGPVAL